MAALPKTYSTIWRWHFYAGILITPIMLIMAITGGVYLYQNEIEDALYSDLFYRQEAGPTHGIDHDAIVNAALATQSSASLSAYQPPVMPNENARVTLSLPNQQAFTVMINPVDLRVVGSINNTWRLTHLSKNIHGGLMAGTTGEVIVELVACWTIIMVITGLYLWWPRMKGLWGVVFPRLNQTGRVFWRDIHAIPGFFLSVWMLVIIVTGLPWSVVWGNALSQFALSIDEAFPQEIFAQRPQSQVIDGATLVTMNQLVQIAYQQGAHHGFEIQAPWGPTGSYAIMPGHHGSDPEQTLYVFVDKFSGNVLLNVTWDDIGAVGKATSLGIALHEGRLFGTLNQLLNLAALVVLIWLGISGMIMWLRRKPKHSLGAPKKQQTMKRHKPIVITMVTLGVILPLAGISMLLIWGLDKVLVKPT